MDKCANSLALSKHMDEIEVAERQYMHFVSTVEANGIHKEYLELRARYEHIAENYGYDIDFEEYIEDNT